MAKQSVKIINLERFQKRLKSLKGAARGPVLKDAAEAGGRVVEGYAKINVEKTFSKHSKGGLAGSIIVETDGTDTRAEAKIGPTVVYGRIQELGGFIKPIEAKLLHWTDPDTGEHRSASQVYIPAKPYLRPALDEHVDEITEAVGAAIEDGIKKVTNGW